MPDQRPSPRDVRASRTSLILDAARKCLEERRALIDDGDDLGAVTVTVRMYAGTNMIKSVLYRDERVARRRSYR